MALTNNQVINKALGEIGIVAEGEAATAAQAADALDLLNQMLAEWSVTDKNLHVPPQDTLSATCPIPNWAETAVITNLAMNCAAPFRAPISDALAMRARSSLNVLSRTLIKANMENADVSHLPQGAWTSWSILTDS